MTQAIKNILKTMAVALTVSFLVMVLCNMIGFSQFSTGFLSCSAFMSYYYFIGVRYELTFESNAFFNPPPTISVRKVSGLKTTTITLFNALYVFKGEDETNYNYELENNANQA